MLNILYSQMLEIYDQFKREPDKKPFYKAHGVDSVVYKYSIDGSDFAIKIYNQGLLLKEAMHYMRSTNKASLLKGLTYSFFGLDVPVSINPINEIVPIPHGSVNISPWIEGKRLYDTYSQGLVGSYLTRQSSGPAWIRELSETINGAQYPYWADFSGLNQKIERSIGVEGVEIDPVNIKVVEEGLVITDLCASIRVLSLLSNH